MANYNCTQLGCVSAQTATYSDLQSCQAACIGWGCPPQLTTNTNILFVYDGSGSYQSTDSRFGMFKSATAWTETLAQNGWVGTADHTIAPPDGFPEATGPMAQNIKHYINTNGVLTEVHGNFAEDWLIHGIIPYSHTNKDLVTGARNEALSWSQALNGNNIYQPIPFAEQQQYFSIYKWRPTLTSNDPLVNTGATYPAVETLVVSFMHQSDNYGVYNVRFKNHYAAWSNMRAAAPNPDHLKAFLFPVKNECTGPSYYSSLQQTVTNGILSILKGNQDDITNGGTGTLDGTWIAYSNGDPMINGNTCMAQYCTTAPYGPGVLNPCVENIYTTWHNCNIAANGPEVLCYWSDSNANGGTPNLFWNWNSSNALTNPFWVAGSPTWGALIDKGWGINVTLLGTNSTVLADALNSQVGTVATQATICISAETDYTTSTDYPYPDLLACNSECFPLLDPWLCPGDGTPCYQDPLGTFGFGPAYPYPTVNDAYTACTAQCQSTTAWTCSNYGCIGDSGGIFSTLSACTASCTSYTCTITGCSLTQGNGGYTALTACTATCVHYECTELCGCVEVPGSGNLSLDYAYATQGQCDEGCIAWKCYDDLGLTPNTKLYVLYDTSSMDQNQARNAYWGIQDYLTQQGLIGNAVASDDILQQHIHFHNERWLGWHMVPYGIRNLDGTDSVVNGYIQSNVLWDQWVEEDFMKWAYGVEINGPYPNPLHFGSPRNNPASPMTTNTAGIGQPTTEYMINTNPANPNYTYLQLIHPQFWVQTAKTTDDVVMIIFADESNNKYHDNSMTLSQAPTPNWQQDYNKFLKLYDIVNQPCTGSSIYTTTTLVNPPAGTGTTSGGPGSFKAFVYPTSNSVFVSNSQNTFNLHVLAGISVGNLLDVDTNTPFTGIWSAGTAPKTTGVGVWNANNDMSTQGTPGYSDFDMGYLAGGWPGGRLEQVNPYMSVNNPSSKTYSAGTGTSVSAISLNYGGLELMGYGMNQTFPVYSSNQFANDLTTFLSGSTSQLTGETICISAATLVSATWPHLELSACTATCVNYDCSDIGCVINTSSGQYDTLSACTAACQSYTCTTTGCSVYNVPYVAANGIIDYSTSWGSGGTYFNTTNSTAAGVYDSQISCQTACQHFVCDWQGCISNPGVAGLGDYSNLNDCLSACTTYSCDATYVNQTNGQPYFTGTIAPCDPIPNDQGDFSDINDCLSGCTSYMCGDIGCFQSNNQYGDYSTLSECTAQCQSSECTNTGCVDQLGSGGTFFNITSFATATASCQTECVSYNCGADGCTTQVGTGGTYSISATCSSECASYNCTLPGCVIQAGSGGTYFNETSLSNAFTACTAQCTSWECGTFGCYEDLTGTGGTYSSLAECQDTPCTSYDCSSDGCVLFNQPPTNPNPSLYYYGTGGQYATSGTCSAACLSFDCVPATSSTVSGCIELAGTGHTYPNYYDCTGTCKTYTCSANGCIIQPNSGGTYPYTVQGLAQCQTACTSYDCGVNDCTPVVGSGGTYWNATNSYLGYTTCTGSCQSYNCYSTGCTLQVGTGGTYTALTSCTASCTSWDCTQDCCQVYNLPYYGTGGTYTTSGLCHTACAHWGCFQVNTGITLTTSKIYAYYDTTSMSQDALKDAILGMNAWVTTLPGFSGNLYHTLINDERWMGWATSVYTGAFADGNTSSVIDNSNAALIYQWAQAQVPQIDSNIYDNCVAGNAWPFLLPTVFSKGPAPTATNTDDVIVVTFIDEAAEPNFGPNTPTSISDYVYHGDDIGCGVPGCIEPQYAGLSTNLLHDQPTETWKEDYTAFTTSFNAVTAATGTFNAFMYPTNGSSLFGGNPINDRNRIFALHAVAAISKGNMTVGTQGENFWPGSAPRTAASGGLSGGVPNLCGIADLTALEVSNPYVLQGYGNLRDKGWYYNVSFSTYTSVGFDNDMSDFLTHTTTSQGTGGTQCLSACTSMSYLYPYTTLSECTGNCASYECTINGCVVSQNTGGTYSTLAACTGDCISWSCTTTGTTSIPGTGATGTDTDYNVIVSGCNSFNCEYDQFGPGNQQGCQQQIGSGGTYTTFSSCTADCRSWECTTNCASNLTGCTEYPNTGYTYTTFNACTGACQVNWYCVPETIINSCGGQQILEPTGGVINNGLRPWTPQYISSGYGALGYFGTPVGLTNHQYDTWSNFSFSMSEDDLVSYGYTTSSISSLCPGPFVSDDFLPPTPGYLVTLQSIQWTAYPSSLGNTFGFPIDYYDWASMISDFIGLGANVNMSMQPHAVFAEIQGTWAFNHNLKLDWEPTFNGCVCLPDPCYVLCDDGVTTIPNTATGPFSTSGAAETSCCPGITWNCSGSTILDTCSGRTQIDYPNQFSNSVDAWDWLTVNSPATNLDTLKYESTTPAFGVDDVCVGPNGGILYEILPISSPYINNNQSYVTWNGFVAQLLGAGVTGIYSGMSYTIVNSHFMAQSGHSLPTCVTLCTCRDVDCSCVEVIGTGGTYTTSGECYSNCCSGTTGTSWECVSGQSMVPICSDKTDMGVVNSPWIALDNFRQNSPASFFGTKKYVSLYDDAGALTPTYSWNDVWASVSSTTTNWEKCYKYISFSLGAPFHSTYTGYKKREYIEYISHPLVTGGYEYNSWNNFYTAAASVTTLNTSMTVSGVCTALSNVVGAGNYSCEIGTNHCCDRRDCYCYKLFVTGGTYSNEPDCLVDCCPTTGWTCYSGNGIPQGICVNVINPQGTFYPTQSMCEDPIFNPRCFPITSWECITGTTVNSCDPSINLYTNSPAIAANNIQYPFTSTTVDLNGQPSFNPVQNLWAIYGLGQVETILTDHNYLNPNTPFSNVSFEYCSGSTASCTGVTNCFGIASNTVYGVNSYPTYKMVSISHGLVYDYTPYTSWGLFVNAAQGLGYAITTGMTADYLHDNTIFSHSTFISVLEPCTCYFDNNACDCIEVPGSQYYPTSAACEQVCCPSGTPITYDCDINGCYDPGNGLGAYNVNQYSDCITECQEWVCVEGGVVLDTCSATTNTIPPGANSTIGALLPQYSTQSPYQQTKYDALNYFGVLGNGLQGTPFSGYKWDCTVGCGSGWGIVPSCLAPYGVWAKLITCFVKPINTTQPNTPLWNGPYSTWTSMLNDLNLNGYTVNSTMTLQGIQTVLSGMTNSQHLELMPVWEPCMCAETDCGCTILVGTGNTGGYDITQSALCESICCSAVCVDECGVIICGESEGVLYYDHAANTTVKLFDDANYQYYDIAARQNKIWIYNYSTIREWEVTWCPFTKTFGRDIGVWPSIMGKGLTPTNSPYKLLTAQSSVVELDISGPFALSTTLYPIPSGLTCTGDIIWDEGSGGNPAHTIITYGSGSTYYVGKFTHPAGLLLEYSEITGLNVGESMGSLYGVNDSSTQIFGITTDRRVFELMTNVTPLEFAPVPTQTLTLQNQLTNKVHGATNVSFGGGVFQHSCTKIESTDLWYCMEIFGCQSFSTPPPSYAAGPFQNDIDCGEQCNFGCECGESAVGVITTPCQCSLTTTVVNPTMCDWYPTLADCQSSLPPVGTIQPGSGCCDCYGCDELTYQYWTPTPSLNTTTITTAPVPVGGVNIWIYGQSYNYRDVVMFTDPYGNRCCYVRVLDYCSSPCSWDFITPWDSHSEHQNSITLNTYLNPYNTPWIACDPDCPTIITYDCISATTGTSNNTNTCLGLTDNGIGPIWQGEVPSYNLLVANGTTNVPFTNFYYESLLPPLDPGYCVSPNGNVYNRPLGFSIYKNNVFQYSSGMATTTVDILVAWCNANIGAGFLNTMTWLQLHQHSSTFPGWAYTSPYHNIRLSHTFCYCSGQNNGTDCHCDEVLGTGGTYVTSALCETYCCSGSTWSCDTTTQIPQSDSCVNCVDTGAQGLSFTPQVFAVAAGGSVMWNTNISTLKFSLGAPPVAGSSMGSYQGQPLIPLANGDAPCPTGIFNWARILEFSCSVYPYNITGGGYVGGPPFVTWADFITALNQNAITYGTGHIFNGSMSYQDVQALAPHIECKWEFCVCTGSPCRGNCVELFDGSGNHSSEDDCLSACCPTYDCTSTGCVNPGTGLGSYTSMTQCEKVCKQWECQSGSTIQTPPCSLLQNLPNNASTSSGGWSQYTMLETFAEPSYNTGTGALIYDLQSDTFSTYKSVIANITPPFSQTCEIYHTIGWPFNTSIFLGYEVYIDNVNIITLPNGTIVSGPFTTWTSIIQYMSVNLGMPASLTWDYQTVQDVLRSKDLTLEPNIKWCQCLNSKCDCVLIPGTGTTPWDMTQYLPCYSACCEETYDCTTNGCVTNNSGTGLFNSIGQCQVVCVEWECISGITSSGCNTKTAIPVHNCQPLPGGYGSLVVNLLDYFSNNLNNLTWTSFNSTKFDQTAPSVYNPQTPDCNAMCTQGVWHYFDTIEMNNNLQPTHQYYINTGPCSSWGDFIIQLNLQPGINNYLMQSYSPTNSSYADVIKDVQNIPENERTDVTISNMNPCICIDKPCDCYELIGTGRTPTQDYYTTSASCLTQCCVEEWYCEPDNNNHQCECLFGTPPLGATLYPSQNHCKKDVLNCCKPQWYDCPNGWCVSLIPGVVGPYATAAACTAAVQAGKCDEIHGENGYDCISLEPGPTTISTQACVGVSNGGQYTPTTALGAPWFGNAYAQCQHYCEGENKPCEKCCVDKFGQQFMLTPTTNPCKCPVNTIEIPIPCGGTPCPHPVECIAGFIYNWSTCECECEQNQSCAIGHHWSYIKCKCVPDIIIGPIDLILEEAEMVVQISDYYNLPIPVVVKDLSDSVDKLERLRKSGFRGDGCVYCTDNIQGVCLYNGCLSLEDLGVGEKPTKIMCYKDGLPIYSRVDGAEDMGRRLGCSGSHQHYCEDGTLGYMPCMTDEEAKTKFTKLKPEKTISNKDPELYEFIREITKLRPKPIPTTTKFKSSLNVPIVDPVVSSECCEWCAKGRGGIAPSGCLNYMCEGCGY